MRLVIQARPPPPINVSGLIHVSASPTESYVYTNRDDFERSIPEMIDSIYDAGRQGASSEDLEALLREVTRLTKDVTC